MGLISGGFLARSSKCRLPTMAARFLDHRCAFFLVIEVVDCKIALILS